MVESMSVFLAGIGDALALFHGLLMTNKKKCIDFINPITYEQRLTIVWYKMKISDINCGTRRFPRGMYQTSSCINSFCC